MLYTTFFQLQEKNHRPWDYPENFLIYSQLDRKSKTCFFAFLKVYVPRSEWDKILISQLSPPKLRSFADQNGPKGRPNEKVFDNFPRKQVKKKGSFIWFSCLLLDLWSLNCKSCAFFTFFCWCQRKIWDPYSNLCIYIWKFSFRFFGKCYWLIC